MLGVEQRRIDFGFHVGRLGVENELTSLITKPILRHLALEVIFWG